MERHIKLSDIESEIKAMYEKYKNLDVDGEVDPRLKNVDSNKFGIVVTLPDGRSVSVGDVDDFSPMGALSRVATFSVHCEQKLGCDCKKHHDKRGIRTPQGEKPADLPISAHAVRLVSKIQPQDDADGKYDVIESMVENMIGSEPMFNDALYESMTKTNAAADVENRLAKAEFTLFDNAPIAIDVCTKLEALQATTKQFAMMGATLAADGRNPLSGQYAFDGEIAPKVVAYMAAKGPHHLSKLWLIKSGIPAMSSFGGTILGVYPGVMSIAAYSPLVNDDGVSIKAYKAIHHIMKHLDLNVFDSAKVVID
ncbi:MAG: glutaminase [Firmicutes bacterium]|nr:glutaminase [Bacillota bacterium]MCM1401641.1 glutaminase [Bacteroides sp.]MCM1477527.1 glutaminase [Bacteroides sp.]